MKKYHATGIPLDSNHRTEDMVFCAEDIHAAYEKVLNSGDVNLKWVVEEIYEKRS